MKMKKLFLVLCMAVFSLGASAQFEKYTSYVSMSVRSLDLSFNNIEKLNFGLSLTGGYFLEDAWMVYGGVGYSHKYEDDMFNVSAGGRYYIYQNGLYLNLGAKYQYHNAYYPSYLHKVHNIYLTPEVGYCFYLNHFLSIEPAIYYDMSMNHFSDFSTVGFRVGVGYYF